MVGGVGAGVGQHDAPLLVGALIALLGPLELLGDDVRLLLRRDDLGVDDHDAGVAVLDAADGAVKLSAAVAAGHVEPLGEGDEAPVALHLMVAGDGDGGDGGVVVAHDLEAGLPLGGLVAVLGGVAAAHDELGRHQGGGVVHALLEGHVVIRGDGLGIGDEDEGELVGVRRGGCLEGVLLTHEALAVAHAVDVHGIRLQVLQDHLMGGQLLPAGGDGIHIAGAAGGLPAALPLLLVLDHRGGDLRHGDPAEPQVALGGVRSHGDLAGIAQDAAVIHVDLDGGGLVIGLGQRLAADLDLQIIEHVAGLAGGQIHRAGGAGDGHLDLLVQLRGIIAVVQHSALHAAGAHHTGGHGGLGVLVHVVHGAGDHPGTVDGEVHRLEDGGVIALQNGLLQGIAPGPGVVEVPAQIHIGLLLVQHVGGDILPLDGLEGRLVARQEGALPGDVAGDVGGSLVVQLADDLIHVPGAGDGGLSGDAADDAVACVEGTGDAAGGAVLAIGADGAGREAVAHEAAAILDAGDAAHVIGGLQVRVDVAVLYVADDGALALLHLSGDAASSVRVGQIVYPDVTSDHAAGDGAVGDADDAAYVLLAADLAVDHGHVLHIGLVILVAHVTEQAHVFLGIVDGQVADGVILAVEGAQIPLLLLGGNGQESLPAGHVDVGGQDVVTVPGGAFFPGAGEIHQLGRGADLIDVLGRIVYRRHGIFRAFCRRRGHQQRGGHRKAQKQAQQPFSGPLEGSSTHKNTPFPFFDFSFRRFSKTLA